MGPMAYQSVDLWPAARNVLTDWWITKDALRVRGLFGAGMIITFIMIRELFLGLGLGLASWGSPIFSPGVSEPNIMSCNIICYTIVYSSIL